MPGNKYEANSTYASSGRLERLLRDREIRRNSKASQSCDVTDNNYNNNRGTQPIENVLTGDEKTRVSSVGQYPEGARVATTKNHERYGKPDKKPIRQRLLVVANRLPVSAVRIGEDVWHLEISAGGLVSALLGMQFDIFNF